MLEKVHTTTLWPALWTLTQRTVNLHYVNNNLNELYFFFLFLYKNINIFKSPFTKYTTSKNIKLFYKPVTKISYSSNYIIPTIYHILRYNYWCIIIIYFLKINTKTYKKIKKSSIRMLYNFMLLSINKNN